MPLSGPPEADGPASPTLEPRIGLDQVSQVVFQKIPHESRQDGCALRPGPLSGDDVNDPTAGDPMLGQQEVADAAVGLCRGQLMQVQDPDWCFTQEEGHTREPALYRRRRRLLAAPRATPLAHRRRFGRPAWRTVRQPNG